MLKIQALLTLESCSSFALFVLGTDIGLDETSKSKCKDHCI